MALSLPGCSPPDSDEDRSAGPADAGPLSDENDAPPADDEPPAELLTPLDSFNLRYFDEYAENVGIDYYAQPPRDDDRAPSQDRTNGGGAALVDLDGDGDLDLVATSPFSANGVYLNDSFQDFRRAQNSGIDDLPHTGCVSAADLDGDGLRDLLICTGHRVAMFRNVGDGRFEEAGTLVDLPPPARAEGVALADLDGDGWVEAYVCTQARDREDGGKPDRLSDRFFRGAGPFEFEDDTDRLGTAEDRLGQAFAATFLDVDRDDDLDLFVLNDKGASLRPSRLYLNPGPGSSEPWVEASEEWTLDLPIDAMGVAVGDVDLDGSLEVAVSDTESRLHVVSVTEWGGIERAAAWGAEVPDPTRFTTSWAPALPDLDNDGDLDLVVAFGRLTFGGSMEPEENYLWTWHQDAKRFAPAQKLLSQRTPGQLEAWRGVLPGDLDGDGMLDLVFSSHVGPISVQKSEANGAGWLEVRLVGPPSNPDGLGSRVDVSIGGHKQSRVVAAGHQGVHSTTEPRPHFGLAQFDAADELRVRWPDGSETVLTDVGGDRIVTVEWGE